VLPAVASALLGLVLIGVGMWLGNLAFSTSIVERVMGSIRPGPVEVALVITAWAVALTAPACFVILGLGRLVHAAGPLRRKAPGSISSLVGTITDEYVGATRVQLDVAPSRVVSPHGRFESVAGGDSRQNEGRWRSDDRRQSWSRTH
jgi:hypothetical protein